MARARKWTVPPTGVAAQALIRRLSTTCLTLSIADRRRSVKVVDPSDLKPLSRGFRFDEQSKIVDIDGTQRIVRDPSPVRHESRSNDVSDVGKATFKKIQRRFAHLLVVAVTPQRIEGIEESP